MQLPKFSLLQKDNLDICSCDRCGRSIKNSYTIKNNETDEVGVYGAGCDQVMMGGKTITEIVQEVIAYEKYEKELDVERMGKIRVQTFSEVNPEMMKFISEGAEDNSFLRDMEKRIQETGSLTENQFFAVDLMMKDFADLGTKVKDLIVEPVTMRINLGFMGGWDYTVIALTENDEKVRIYFSSLSLENEELLKDLGVLSIDRDGDWVTYNVPEDRRKKILLSGAFDGYKVKRAKIKLLEEGLFA